MSDNKPRRLAYIKANLKESFLFEIPRADSPYKKLSSLAKVPPEQSGVIAIYVRFKINKTEKEQAAQSQPVSEL